MVLLGLAALVAADLEVKPIQEDISEPGVTSTTYAIVQDGRVVGMVEHYRSEGGLGRRFGPPSERSTPVAQLLMQLWASQADALAGMRDRLLAAPTRCPFARQMALARLQAAAATAATQGQDLHMLQHPVLPSTTKPMFGPGTLLLDGPDAGLRGAAMEPMRRRPVGGDPSADDATQQHMEQPTAAAQQDPASYLADVSDLDLNIVKVEPWEPQESDPGYNPEMNPLPAGERPPLFGADGRPLVPRQRPAIAFDMGVEHKPVEGWREPAFEEEQPAGEARDEPGALPVLAMLWARFAREPLPRGPTPFGEEQPPFGGRPEPLPPLGRPHPHHGMMHGMPHRHGMPHSHGMVHRPAPMHGEPAMRRPGLWGPGPMPRIVGSEVLLQRRDGRWVPLAEAAPAAPLPEWRLWGPHGEFNWALATFIVLASACVAVWGMILAQCAACRRAARLNHPATAFFITRVDSEEEAALKPLLHEGPVKGCAVEHASAHVAGAQPAKVLSYEPLKGSDDGAH